MPTVDGRGGVLIRDTPVTIPKVLVMFFDAIVEGVEHVGVPTIGATVQ